MVRGIPIIFGQRDFTQTIGFSPTATIANYGCLLTSMAMIARYYGKITDPVDLNKTFKANNIYIGTDELTDDALTKVFPDIIFQESFVFPDATFNPDGSVNTPAVPADLAKLKFLMDDPTLSVIVEIDVRGIDGHFESNHFAVCVGVNGIVTIDNPWDKQQEDFSILYGDPVKNIIKYIVYKGTPASVDQQLLDQLRQQRDANWNLHLEDLHNLTIIKDQVSNLQTQIQDLTKKSNEQANEIITLNSTIQTMAGSNKDYASEALTSGQQETALREYLHAIAGKVGISKTNINDGNLAEQALTNINSLQNELQSRDQELNKLKQSIPQKMVEVILSKNKSLWQKFIGLFWT